MLLKIGGSMIRLTHNGYKVELFDNVEESDAYIDNVLNKYSNLDPKEIYRHSDKQRTVIIFRYHTIYAEMFMIENLIR